MKPVSGFAVLCLLIIPQMACASMSEIKVDLRLDGSDFVIGERIRGVVDIANSSPDRICCGKSGDPDRFFIEVFRTGGYQMNRISRGPFVASFDISTGEGQKLETFLGDHYDFRDSARYLAKPVLVHDGVRYEGAPRVFDMVDGVRLGGAMQMFANKRGLQREFEVVYWTEGGREHLYLKAKDTGVSSRRWETRDLGPILRIDKPTVSVLTNGEVLVMHRMDADNFIRNEFWSVPSELYFRQREAVPDPETAGTKRVRELYKEGSIKPKERKWWKFWE